jgi:hypothetical protein
MTDAIKEKKLFKKTDSAFLDAKLRLRRQVIAEAGFSQLRVLDLFAGDGTIWTELRRQPRTPNGPPALDVVSYVPVDSAKRQDGQIQFKIQPRLIEALNLDRYDVIDIDCYGEPWSIWQPILFKIRQPTVVFLTRGRVAFGSGRMQISNVSKMAAGIPVSWDAPCKIELLNHADRCALLQPCPTAKIEFGKFYQYPRATYYGLYVKPIQSGKGEESGKK